MKKIVMTVAGSDPSCGAGIQADLKTFAALGTYGVSVIAALTAQNTREVRDVFPVPPEFVAMQLETLLDDVRPDATKTGMLYDSAIVRTVAEILKRRGVPNVVVDPVTIATSGGRLLKADAVEAVIADLFPLAFVATPNVPEAEALTGTAIRSVEGMKEAARIIAGFGPKNVIVKGGHLEGSGATDLLYANGEFVFLEGERLPAVKGVHGTGCVFSAALAAELAKGADLLSAAETAKRITRNAMASSFPIGSGAHPADPSSSTHR